MASGNVTFEGNWRKELRDLKKGMDKVAAKAALAPLSAALAVAALKLGIERASKLAPASTMFSRSTSTQFVLGTTQKGAAAHQFGATIRPVSVTAAREGARRAGMAAARSAVGTKSSPARQFVREAGRSAIRSLDTSAFVAYLTFRVAGQWVRKREVKLPVREIFPLKGVPESWSDAFERVAGESMRALFPGMG